MEGNPFSLVLREALKSGLKMGALSLSPGPWGRVPAKVEPNCSVDPQTLPPETQMAAGGLAPARLSCPYYTHGPQPIVNRPQ